MSEIDRHLRELGRLSREHMASEAWQQVAARLARAARATALVEMTGEAVAARLRAMSGASRLCASLAPVRRDRPG